ncbi:MAG: cytochrome c [Arenicellales bacterium]|nr:cytochrome c [Arenicellales bacterium]
MSKKTTVILSLFVSLAIGGTANAQEGTVKYRQGLMGAIGGHAEAIAQIAYGGVDYTDHLVGHTEALKALTTLVLTAFREEAITEDPPTRAKEEIWQEWPKFEGYVNDLEQAAADVAKTAAGGDVGAVAGSLDPLWDSCKGCHESFRKRR